jgi:hypothetical protein
MALMELLLQEMDEDNGGNASTLDDYLMGFWEGGVNMDLNTIPSVDSDDPTEDLDLTFGEEDMFDAIGTLLPLTVV